MNDKQRQELGQLFEDTLNDEQGLENYFRETDLAEYEDIITEELEAEGYPMEHISYEDVHTSMGIWAKTDDPDIWIDQFIDDYDLENASNDDIDAQINESNVYECIFNNPDKLTFAVIIHDSIEEVLDRFPPYDYFVEKVMKDFDMIGLRETLLNMDYHMFSDNIQSQVEDAVADELGSDVNTEDVELSVTPKPITEVQAEALYDLYDLDNESLNDYLNTTESLEDMLYTDTVEVEVIIEED